MKRWTAWKSGAPTTSSTWYGSTGAGRIATGGIGGRRSQRTYALRPIHLQCVRGLLSHNDNDPLQEVLLCGSVSGWGGSERLFFLTQPQTSSIFVQYSC